MEASAAKISKTCFSESNMFEKHSAMFRIFWNMVKQNFENMMNDKLYQSKRCYISCFSCSQSPKRAGRCSPRSGSMRPALLAGRQAFKLSFPSRSVPFQLCCVGFAYSAEASLIVRFPFFFDSKIRLKNSYPFFCDFFGFLEPKTSQNGGKILSKI